MFKICRSNCLDLDAYKSLSLSAALSLSFSLNLFRKLKTQKESFHPKMYTFLQYSFICFASKLKRFARAGFYRVRSAACRSHSAKAAEGQIRSKGESLEFLQNIRLQKIEKICTCCFSPSQVGVVIPLVKCCQGANPLKKKIFGIIFQSNFSRWRH